MYRVKIFCLVNTSDGPRAYQYVYHAAHVLLLRYPYTYSLPRRFCSSMALLITYVMKLEYVEGRSLFSMQVNSVKATEQLYNAIDASDKQLSLYPV